MCVLWVYPCAPVNDIFNARQNGHVSICSQLCSYLCLLPIPQTPQSMLNLAPAMGTALGGITFQAGGRGVEWRCLPFQAVGSFHRPLKLLNLTLLNQHAIVDACRAGPLEESYPESEALLSWALVSLVIALFLQLMFAESHKFDWWVLCNQRPCFVYLTCCQVILSGEEDHVLPLLNLPSIIMSFLHCTLSTYCTQ